MEPNENPPQAPHNPYAAPQARVADAAPVTGELASRWLRLGGAVIDTIILVIVVIPLAFVFGLGAAFTGQAVEPGPLMQIGSVVLGFVVFVAVQGYFLHSSGQTIAKKLLKMRIVDENGNKPEFVKLLGLRYAVFQFAQLIPFLGYVVGLVNVLFIFRDDRRCLHDLLAGTRVVMTD
ncbi:RDD family protein [Aquimonas sp.]|jgi:uncharacterized RDD family membrane protein YckC|uniref:RDD family protein n=1 Tax=Aquimonas sp. TaxID=1872588 RepID=UPI0037BE2B41